MDGIASVQTRIQDIISQFQGPPAASPLGGDGTTGTATTSAGTSSDFASMLAEAQLPDGATGAAQTTGELNRAGVDPVQWAKDFLTRLGMPLTASNLQAITAWEQAEGTKAAFNPLATTQGGFAGETTFNHVGVKNYVSYQDGIDANVKVITNGLYPNILAALQRGDSAQSVAEAVANSPWGTGGLVEKILRAQGA